MADKIMKKTFMSGVMALLVTAGLVTGCGLPESKAEPTTIRATADTSGQITVPKQTDGTDIDPTGTVIPGEVVFAAVQVEFAGLLSGFGYVESIKCDAPWAAAVKFTALGSNKDISVQEQVHEGGDFLKNGDHLAIRAVIDPEVARAIGYSFRIFDETEDFVVSGLPEAVTAKEQVAKDLVPAMRNYLSVRYADGVDQALPEERRGGKRYENITSEDAFLVKGTTETTNTGAIPDARVLLVFTYSDENGETKAKIESVHAAVNEQGAAVVPLFVDPENGYNNYLVSEDEQTLEEVISKIENMTKYGGMKDLTIERI